MKSNYVFISSALVACALCIGMPGSAGAADSSASVKGVVKFAGAAPKLSRIDMSQDPLCAKAHRHL